MLAEDFFIYSFIYFYKFFFYELFSVENHKKIDDHASIVDK